MMNRYYKKTRHPNKFREFIRVLNGIWQLTERESDLLAYLMELDANWSPDSVIVKHLLSTDSRKWIMKESGMHKSNLSLYSRTLKDKKIIIVNDKGNVLLNPLFKAINTDNKFEVNFTIDFNKTE